MTGIKMKMMERKSYTAFGETRRHRLNRRFTVHAVRAIESTTKLHIAL